MVNLIFGHAQIKAYSFDIQSDILVHPILDPLFICNPKSIKCQFITAQIPQFSWINASVLRHQNERNFLRQKLQEPYTGIIWYNLAILFHETLEIRQIPWFNLWPPGFRFSEEDVDGIMSQCLADSSSDVVKLTLESFPGMQFLVIFYGFYGFLWVFPAKKKSIYLVIKHGQLENPESMEVYI